jgi:hypothetical protein
VNGPSPSRLRRYLTKRLRLRRYLRRPGDGRRQPLLPASTLLWALLIALLLRCYSFPGVEALARSRGRRALGIARRFGDDALAYFTARLDPEPTREALAAAARRAKRNKAFAPSPQLGLVIDGASAGWRRAPGRSLCRPHSHDGQIHGYQHSLVMLSVTAVGPPLPLDVEPSGPGDSEYAAGQSLLQRTVGRLGRRFAKYLVVDSEFATAPFLHSATALSLGVAARLKANLPTLYAAAQQRLGYDPAPHQFRDGKDRVELWDRDDFQPWDSLQWPWVRVIFYRQHKPDGRCVEAYWLSNFSPDEVPPRLLYRMAKSRWEIENQGFNDAKNRYGFQHIRHHHPNSLLLCWLLTALALAIERLYRLRYLRRGKHPPRSAAEFHRELWLSLSDPPGFDSS